MAAALAGIARLEEHLDLKLDGESIRITKVFTEDDLNSYSLLQKIPVTEKKALVELCATDASLDKVMGAVCGMAVGDALGHPFEYITVTDEVGTSHFDLASMDFHGDWVTVIH